MKKLIAISVVFALVAGAVFAVDVTGTVFGHVNVIEGNTGKNRAGDSYAATASGGMDRVRIDGSGEAGDGEFGGYIRYQGGSVGVDSAYAWWKPVDQFKLIIGGFSDGFWGKEGVTGWGFNQMPNDSSVAVNYGIWCGSGWGSSVYANGKNPFLHNRYTFFEGFVHNGLSMEITPADMIGINVGIPAIDDPRTSTVPKAIDKDEPKGKGEKYGTAADVYKASVVQFDVKMDFGNIALTYDGSSRAGMAAKDAGAIFLYYGGSFGDLSIDFGFSYHLVAENKDNGAWGQNPKSLPFGVGLGVKYATDSFGVKFRTTAVLGGDKERGGAYDEYDDTTGDIKSTDIPNDSTVINASVLPYFSLGDNLMAFVNVGFCMVMQSSDFKDIKWYNGGENVTGWYFNPYLRVGAEWGPTFYFGIQAWCDGLKAYGDSGDATKVNWAVPISLMVSF